MKTLAQFITEKQNFIVNKKLSTPYNRYEYSPKAREELIENIIKIINQKKKSIVQK